MPPMKTKVGIKTSLSFQWQYFMCYTGVVNLIRAVLWFVPAIITTGFSMIIVGPVTLTIAIKVSLKKIYKNMNRKVSLSHKTILVFGKLWGWMENCQIMFLSPFTSIQRYGQEVWIDVMMPWVFVRAAMWQAGLDIFNGVSVIWSRHCMVRRWGRFDLRRAELDWDIGWGKWG